MATANEEQAEFWTEMAPTWVEIDDRLEEVGGPPGRLAMDRLELLPGARVLDLGCGTGNTTIELAGRAAPGGRAIGVDIAAPMLEAARARAERQGVTDVEYRHADAQVDDLGDAVFDAAFSRFGVMFFADPVAAFANVRRALRPGGTLSFACWQGMLRNEWMLVPGGAAIEALGAVPEFPEPGAPGPFSLEDPDRIRDVLTQAGFTSVDIAADNSELTADESRVGELAATSNRVGVVRELLREADGATRQRAYDAVEQALRARVVDGQVRLSRGVHLVLAR